MYWNYRNSISFKQNSMVYGNFVAQSEQQFSQAETFQWEMDHSTYVA